jgi:hypothetical protein
MALARSLSINKIWVGYSGSACRRVWRGGVCADLARNFGAAVFGLGFGASIWAAMDRAHGWHRSTHFCGFQGVQGARVGLAELVQFWQDIDFARLCASLRLIGHSQGARLVSFDQRRPSDDLGGTVAGGATPSWSPRCLDRLSRSPDLKSGKKFTPENRSCHFSGISHWMQGCSDEGMRESYSVRTGSGVRVAREAAMTGRLVHHRHLFLKFWVRVQSVFPHTLGMTGSRSLCGGSRNVN